MTLSPEQAAEIAAAACRASPPCARPCPRWRRSYSTAFPVLDHGFVRVMDYMGDDAAMVQAARVSYGRGTRRGWRMRG